MGYDRVRFYDGDTAESTLVSADKSSHGTLISPNTLSFLRQLGHNARLVVDANKPSRDTQAAVRMGAVAIDLPPKVIENDELLGGPVAWEPLVEVKPPFTPDSIKPFLAYLDVTCEPSDAGPLFLDHRGEHVGCAINRARGSAYCPADEQRQATELAEALQFEI